MLSEGPIATLVKWLVEFNAPGARPPRVFRDVSEEEDLNQAADRDTKIHGMGFDPSEEYINTVYPRDWTKRAAVRPISSTPNQSPAFAGCPNCGGGANFATPTALDDALDKLRDEVLDDWEQLANAFAEPIRRLAADSANLAEFQRRLSEALGDMDVGGGAEHLARTAFAARLAGETGVDVTTEE